MYWFVLKSILSGIIGSSFYKWWQDTSMGLWFQRKLDGALEYVQNKYDLQVFEKEQKFLRNYPTTALRLEELERRVQLLEGALDNLIPERRQGAD